MKLIVHDLPEEQAKLILPQSGDIRIIGDDGTIHPCIGCFGCWVKTPAQCVIRDSYGDIGKLLSQSEELIFVSKCCYGGFSPFVKNVMDRGISYSHPCFTIRDGEMHHRRRYDNHFTLSAFFYGSDMTQQEKETAGNLLQANARNLDCTLKGIHFAASADSFRGEIK